MRLELLSNDGSVAHFAASGRITQDAFQQEAEPLAEQLGEAVYTDRVLLSLQGADYLDSRGVGWLLKCHRRFRKEGGILVVHSIPTVIMDVLKVLHMDEVLNLACDEQAARSLAMATHDS